MKRKMALFVLTVIVFAGCSFDRQNSAPVTVVNSTTTTTSTTLPSTTTSTVKSTSTTRETTTGTFDSTTEKLILTAFHSKYPRAITPDDDLVLELAATVCPSLNEGTSVEELMLEVLASDGPESAQEQILFLIGVTIAIECPEFRTQIDELQEKYGKTNV